MVSIFKRETLNLTVRVTGGAGNPKNLTDAYARWTLVRPFGKVILEKDTDDDSLNIQNETEGILRLELDEEQTDIKPGEYKHVMRVTDDNGDTQVVLFEEFEVKETHEQI